MIKEKNIFIIGIKGVAMSNLAIILKKMGKNISGSDIDEEFITDKILKRNKINYTIGFCPLNLPKNIDLVIYSAAHSGINNPQVKEAKKRGIKVKSQAEVLGDLSKEFKTTIAVCGCHGKTTTASLLSYALLKLETKVSYLVGSSDFNGYNGGDYNPDTYFVVEADEYGVNPPFDKTPKFHYLRPKYIICTNIDFDHPDIYENINEVKKAFLKFFENSINQSKNIQFFLCSDDKNLMTIAKKIPRRFYFTFGFDKKADFRVINSKINEDNSLFELVFNGHKTSYKISLFGEKNISNAAGVVSLLFHLKYSPSKIKEVIADFAGAKRRFEKSAFINDIYLFDDYAHHPREIEATINAARKRFPKKRIIIIFQPHTYSRTQRLLKEFSLSLSLADKSLILPIFSSAREKKTDFNISSGEIVKFDEKNKLIAVNSKEELLKKLAKIVDKNDIIFTMGAGDVYKLKDDIIEIITEKRE